MRTVGSVARSAARRLSSSAAPLPHSALTSLDIQHLTSIVGPSNAVTDAHALEVYNTDWTGQYKGTSRLALRPGSTEEVSRVLAHCNRQRIPVVPQGGNTGLVGGGVPLGDEVVLSLSRMDRVLSLDEHSGHLICQAGCVLENLQNHVWERGYTMPLDLGAKGSCQIVRTPSKAAGVATPSVSSLAGASAVGGRVATWLPTPAGSATCVTARCTVRCLGWRLSSRTGRCSTR